MTDKTWANRIVGEGMEAPDQLLANPANWRVHGKAQQDALEGVLNEVGWVDHVIVNQQTGHLVDGHLRVTLALRRGEPSIPVHYVDLSESEESLVLATLDPIAAMASADRAQLEALLRDVQTGEAGVQAMLAELAEREGVIAIGGDDWANAFDKLPDEDRAPFQQMTFTVSDEQAELVRVALSKAKNAGSFEDTGNENSNGNALHRICVAYVG